MSLRGILLGAVLLGAGVGVGLWIGSRGKPPVATGEGAGGAAALTVSVIKAQKRSIGESVRAVGSTVSREEVVVIPELTGLRISSVDAEVGDYVRAGQTLAQLDGSSIDLQQDELRSELERTRGEYERARVLLQTQLVSREFVNQKRTAYEVARSRHESAQLDRRRTRIVAPAAGLIYKRTAAIGGLTNGDEVLFSIAKDGVVEMEAKVPESSVGRLRRGMPAKVEIAGRPTPVEGEIRLIAPLVDGASRVAGVRIRLTGDSEIPVGAYCSANIDVAQVGGWALPRTALQRDTRGEFVWIVDDAGKVKRHPVAPIAQTVETVVVGETLDAYSIVAKAGPFLKEGDTVKTVALR